MSKDRLVSVRVPDELRDRIREQAQAKHLTMSAYVRDLIDAKLNRSKEDR